MEIVLAHRKKPPGETRIFEKLGHSLCRLTGWHITILGNKIPFPFQKEDSRIQLVPLFRSENGKQFLIRDLWLFFRHLVKNKPALIVVCSPDLLPVALLYKGICRAKVVFDIQENFALNFSHQDHYRFPRNQVLSIATRLYLWICQPFTDQFWLAEQVYVNQKGIPATNYLVLENKVPSNWKGFINSEIQLAGSKEPIPYFLFTGFLTKTSGVHRAVAFFEQFEASVQGWNLIVAGYCADRNLREWLQMKAINNSRIRLVGMSDWVSSSEICRLLIGARAILMPYHESDANRGKIPTKAYEAAFLAKTIVLQEGSQFKDDLEKLTKVVCISYEEPDKESITALRKQLEGQSVLSQNSAMVFDSDGVYASVSSLLNISLESEGA